MSELVTAHDPKKPETAGGEITHAVIFPNSKKVSKLGTETQFRKLRRVRRDEARRGEARRAVEEEGRVCKPLLFSHFRR
jgi:hypothetical protein